MSDVIEVEATPRKPYNVRLVGQEYRALPPKALVAVDFGKRLKAAGDDAEGVIGELEVWLATIFGRTVAPQIMARLRDQSDELDLPHIMELIKKLSEKATGNPTTSPSDS